MIDFSVMKSFTYAKKFKKGTVLAQFDDESFDKMYIVLMGSVGLFDNIEKGSDSCIAIIEPGGHFGEEALFHECRPTAAAIALEDIIAVPISRDDAVEFIRDEPEMAFEIMKDLVPLNKSDRTHLLHGGNAGSFTENLQKQQKHASPVNTKSNDDSDFDLGKLSLFPEGHGSYELDLSSQNKACLMEKKLICPLCGKKFTTPVIRRSKLIAERTDQSMRTFYKGIEPLYFDVVTCPDCYYSALLEVFSKPNKAKTPPEELEKYREEFTLGRFSPGTGNNVDISTVFAGYYLALLCAPLCFRNPELMTAKLLLKLSRIYSDCEDKAMELELAKKALDAYNYAYQNVEIEQRSEQQLCLIIGELSYRLGDYKMARDFLFRAKIIKPGTPALKRRAEDLIEDVKVAESKGSS